MIDNGTVTGNVSVEITVSPVEYAYQALKRELLTEDIGDGTGTVELQVSPTGAAPWLTRASVTLGTPLEFNVYPGETFRLTAEGGTAPDFNYWVF